MNAVDVLLQDVLASVKSTAVRTRQRLFSHVILVAFSAGNCGFLHSRFRHDVVL